MAMSNVKDKFEGRNLIEVPRVDYLRGEFGREIHEEIKVKYADFLVVTENISYDKKDKLVNGSKPYYVVAANEMLRQIGLHTATPVELEMVVSANARNSSSGLNLRGNYEDSALVLRSEGEPNSYLAGNLLRQLKMRNPKVKLPVMIPLNGFDLERNQDSSSGLSFKLRDDADIIYAPILNLKDGRFNSQDVDVLAGLPIKLCNEGERYFYTRNSGLSRLCLIVYLNLNSYNESLAYSYAIGRVVVVSGEAAGFKIAQELEEQRKANFRRVEQDINALYEARKSDLERRLNQAKIILSEDKK